MLGRSRQTLAGLVGLMLVMPLPAVAQQFVFVTSAATANANLSGLAGGDAICSNAASAAGLPGAWVAWLSSDEIDAATRLRGNGPFRRIDGVEIAATRAALLDGTLDAPINVDENGNTIPVSGFAVWTGTNTDGTSSGVTCMGWTSASGGLGTVGGLTLTDSHWTAGFFGGCGNIATRLYCFQQGLAPSVRAPLLAVGPALGAVVLALLVGGWIELRRRSPRAGA